MFIQAGDSMCGYFCVGFIDFYLIIISGCPNLFSPNESEKNDKKILKNFQ